MKKYKDINIASILGVLGNVFLLVIKAIIGFISGSAAMIADAFNSAGDIFTSLVTYIGNKISSKPRDDDHNLGHGKAEYIYSLLISVVMILITLVVFKNSVMSIFNRRIYDFSIWLVIVCVITIIIKFLLFIYTKKLSKKHKSILLRANSKDHINDTIVTFFNLISIVFAYFNIYMFDGIVGVGISIWIIIEYLRIFKESYDILMDKAISDADKNRVYEIINKYDEIKKINHFNSTPVGYKYQISVTIFVDGNLSTFESHEIADKLEKEIIKEVEDIYLAVIHVNPI